MNYAQLYNTAKADVDRKMEELRELKSKCDRAKRPPNDSEIKRGNKLLEEVEEHEKDMARWHFKGKLDETDGDVPKPDLGNSQRVTSGYEKRQAHESKSFQSLFGNGKNTHSWRDRDTSFYQAALGGRYHPELSKRSLNEGIPSDGGYLVPVEYSKKIHQVSIENEIIFPRAQIQPMISNEIKIPGFEIGSHATNLAGGFKGTWTAEEAAFDENNPKTRMMTLHAHKLAGFMKISNELLADMNGSERISELAGAGIAWYREDSFINGSGAGQPQGILNANCKITVAKESGQAADSVILENLNKMLSQLYSGGYRNAIWLASQSVLPQLLQLSLSVGTGGGASKAMEMGPNGNYQIYGLDVLFSEHCPTLGDAGDINLVDLSQYIIGVKEEIRLDMSGHVYFASDQTAIRVITRCDGQFLWDEPLTLQSGTDVSPMISLGERA